MPPFSMLGAAIGAEEVGEQQAAEQAYSSLCFDFPVVPTTGLVALSRVYRSDVTQTGKLQFPLTLNFISGLRYLVATQVDQQGVSAPLASSAAAGSDDAGRNALLLLCACVFLKAPARRLAVAPRDDRDSLNRFLASFCVPELDEQQPPSLEEGRNEIEESLLQPCTGGQELRSGNDEMAAELDDDNTVWEPLEAPGIESQPVERAGEEFLRQANVVADWSELISKVIALTSFIPFEVVSSGVVWEELRLTDDLIHSLKALRVIGKEKGVNVIGIARLYAGLLCDHITGSPNVSTSGAQIRELVTATLAMAVVNTDVASTSTTENRAWEHLALRVLANLSSNVGGSANQRRSLWQVLSSNLSFLEQQLDKLICGYSSNEWAEHVEMVLQSLCFWLKHAPGNASVGSTLLQTGILRTALQLFLKAGEDPQMETLREFLLQAMASSSQVAQYLGNVPAFQVAITEATFLRQDSLTRAHGLVWPLLLRAGYEQQKLTIPTHFNHAEKMLVDELTKVSCLAEANAVANNPLVLTRLLQILQLLVVACFGSRGSSIKLWPQGSSLDSSLAHCHMALRAVVVPDALPGPVTSDNTTEDKSNRQPKSAEKVSELVSRVLPLLKQLAFVNKGDGCSKVD
jgi:hypothetical protein